MSLPFNRMCLRLWNWVSEHTARAYCWSKALLSAAIYHSKERVGVELSILLMQFVNPRQEHHDPVFSRDLVSAVCASHERGLQLLLMDYCDLDEGFQLPASLRYLFLSNR
jgi:hypothetical protein